MFQRSPLLLMGKITS